VFTGIVQGIATVESIDDVEGLRRLRLAFADAAALDGVALGASIAVAGVCLTVTSFDGRSASFDAMDQTLRLTTLGTLRAGARVNVERAARADAEVGGHPLSGHVDAQGRIESVRTPENNHVLRIAVPAPWMRYLFAKGYVAVDGASLTIAQAERRADGSGWFEVWLIPETLRVTTFGERREGDAVNLEIDRATQVVVDTVRDAVAERLGALAPAIERLLAQQGLSLDGAALLPASAARGHA
jgi:riboflavin synthase